MHQFEVISLQHAVVLKKHFTLKKGDFTLKKGENIANSDCIISYNELFIPEKNLPFIKIPF
mgnify:CR=1 FL=1